MLEISRVLAVIVSYYPNIRDLSALIESIGTQVCLVLVIDNTDAEDDRVSNLLSSCAKHQDKMRIIRVGRNIGVAAALNIGISVALDEGYSHVLLSDQDSLPDPNMVSGLLSAEFYLTSQGLSVGAVGPQYEDQETGYTYPFQVQQRGKLFYSRIRATSDCPILRVCSLITSGSLIQSEVLRSVGGMREDFFIDGIDWEWCHRAASLGYGVYGSSLGKMAHNMGQGRFRVWIFGWTRMSLYNPSRIFYGVRNYTYLLRLGYVPLRWKIRVGVYWIANVYAHLAFSQRRRNYIMAVLSGVFDGLRGRLGEIPRKYSSWYS